MGPIERMNSQTDTVFPSLEPITDHRDEPGTAPCRAKDLSESACISWESAWIDLGGEG